MTDATKTPRLSPAQRRFLAAVDAAGPGGHCSPSTGGRESVTLVSAWWRTAESLQRRGLVRVAKNGSTGRAWGLA
jgi:hypothetical protein